MVSHAPLTLYLDRSGDMTLDSLDDETEEVGVEGFGTQSFGSSSFGLGLRSGLRFIAKRYAPSERQALDYRRVANGAGDFQVEIPGGFELHEWTEAEAAILDNAGEELFFRGRVTEFDHSEARSTARLEGHGLAGDLQRGSATNEYAALPAWRAFEDYADRFLAGWALDITAPSVDVLFRERELADVGGVRDELEAATDLTDTDPIDIVDGALEVRQTCFTTEAEEDDSRSINGSDSETAGNQDNSNYSNGTGVRLDAADEYIEYLFEPEYTIPQLRVGVRCKAQDAPKVEVFIGDGDGRTSLGTVVAEGETAGVQWVDMREFGEDARNLSDVTHLRFEATTDATTASGFCDLDVIAPYDMRFDFDFDNAGTTDSDGTLYLDGPEHYADDVRLPAERAAATANIEAARIESTWNDTSNGQAVELSNDERLWDGDTQTASTAVDFEGASFGYGVTPRFSFSGYGERDSATPRTGYKAQRLSGWTVYGDGNDLQVIEEKTVEGNHLKNLSDIAERAELLFYAPQTRPSETNQLVAFHPGQNQHRLPVGRDERDDLTSTKSTSGYANRVTVKGKRDPETGERPEATVQDDDEIARRGGEDDPDAVVDHDDIDATLETATDCGSKADQLLAEKTGEDEFSGALENVPFSVRDDVPLHPGRAYMLDEWGTFAELQEIQATDTGLTLDFEGDDDMLEEIKQTRQRADDAHKAQ